MTNDEAIYTLKNTAWLGWAEQAEKVSEAVQMAVEALKRETSCDAISRQGAIRWVKTECNPYGKPTLDFESGKRVMEHLKTMPSAQSEDCDTCKHGYFGDDQCERCRVRYPSHYERRTDG